MLALVVTVTTAWDLDLGLPPITVQSITVGLGSESSDS